MAVKDAREQAGIPTGGPTGGAGPSEGPLTTLTLQHALAVGNVAGQYAVLAYISHCCL